MNFSRRRQRPRSERWEREDSAPRLSDVAPSLRELKLELREERENATAAGSASIRHVVVATAAAFFEFKCAGCTDGNYDITNQVLSGLDQKLTRFEGTRRCLGFAGSQPCERTLAFVAHAAYSPDR